MGSESSSSTLSGSVNLQVSDHAFLSIESLSFGILLSILKKVENVLDTLLWPSSLIGFEFFGLSSSSNSAMLSEWYNSLVL